MRFSDSELSLIKNTFADNEELLKAIRKSFLQLPLDPIDVDILNTIKGKKEVCAVLRKAFLPDLDGNAPMHQVIDLWMTLEIKDKDPETVKNNALARAKLIEYIDEQLTYLETGNLYSIYFSDLVELTGKSALEIFVDLNVRNTVIAHVEMQINQFLVLAGDKAESVEKTKERLQKNSSK